MDLTQTHLRVLAHLSRNEGSNQAALADILEIQPITLTRLIDRLEEADLVERRRDPDDRRAQRLFLTTAAAPIMDQLWEMVSDMHETALAGLSLAVREKDRQGPAKHEKKSPACRRRRRAHGHATPWHGGQGGKCLKARHLRRKPAGGGAGRGSSLSFSGRC